MCFNIYLAIYSASCGCEFPAIIIASAFEFIKKCQLGMKQKKILNYF